MARQTADGDAAFTQDMGMRRTALGQVRYIKVRTPSERPLSWTEIWKAFSGMYPGQWAVEAFPPEEELVDEANIYHLFILEDFPGGAGFNINRRR
jgi:hypothetical protein